MQRMETYLCSGGRRRRRWRGGCFLLFPGVAPLPFGLFFFSAYDAPLFPCFLGFSMGSAPGLSSGFRSQKIPVFVRVLASSSVGSLPSFSFLNFSFLSQFFFVWFVLSVLPSPVLLPCLCLCPVFSVQDEDNGGKSTRICCWLRDQNFPRFCLSSSPLMVFFLSWNFSL